MFNVCLLGIFIEDTKPFNFHTFIVQWWATESKKEKLPMQVHAHPPTPMYKKQEGNSSKERGDTLTVTAAFHYLQHTAVLTLPGTAAAANLPAQESLKCYFAKDSEAF